MPLRLRYLKLNSCENGWHIHCEEELNALLEYCHALSVLIVDDFIPVSENTLQQILAFCPNLQKAWLPNNHHAGRFRPETLARLERRLISRGGETKDFCIVVTEMERDELVQHAPNLTYICEDYQTTVPRHFSLRHSYMRRFLNLGF